MTAYASDDWITCESCGEDYPFEDECSNGCTAGEAGEEDDDE